MVKITKIEIKNFRAFRGVYQVDLAKRVYRTGVKEVVINCWHFVLGYDKLLNMEVIENVYGYR